MILAQGATDTDEFHIYPTAEEILTFDEAARIRSGLEEYRRHFCSLIDDLIEKGRTVDPSDPQAYMSLEVKDVVSAAQDYLNRIATEAAQQVSKSRRNTVEKLRTGFSAAIPVVGLAADTLLGSTPAPGFWTATGTILSVGSLLMSQSESNVENSQKFLTSRQRAYLFMNRLWDISDARPGAA